VTLYTRDFGKIKVIARGVLKPSNPFAGKLETLNYLDVVIAFKLGRSLQNLTQADLRDTFSSIRPDMRKLPYAMAALEVLNQVLDEQHQDELFFDFFLVLLNSFHDTACPAVIFWYLLLKLSSFLGFKPSLEVCSACGNPNPAAPINFAIERGLMFCADCQNKAALSVILGKEEWNFLYRLQRHPHRRMTEFVLPVPQTMNFTQLLLNYLNIHLDRKLTVNALDLLID